MLDSRHASSHPSKRRSGSEQQRPRHVTGTEPSGSPGVRAAVGADVLLVTHKPPGPQREQEEGVRGRVAAGELGASSQRLRRRQGSRLWGETGLGGHPGFTLEAKKQAPNPTAHTLSGRSSPPCRLSSSSFCPPLPPTWDCISRQAPRPAANEGLRIWRRRRRRRSESRVGGLSGGGGGGRTEAEAERDQALIAAERRAKAKSSPEDPAAPARPPATALSLAAAAARRPPIPPPPLPTPPPAAFLLFASRPARPGRGPPRCRQPWQRRPARGKSSPGISCGLAWFRLLPRSPGGCPHPSPTPGLRVSPVIVLTRPGG
ncbi:unnamed protein product [Nyctereutes procyonoides]|uniref:(raccoon dog) hypothetical protein n=1 Tax=Nyctereutes procyonoides TaxID=34880 RepID=A0A811YRZ7_NYCPR|nr:unnamed protein product [Nyctereutes procyonoides]